MELNITELVKRDDLIYYSASAMELGQDAGKVTWENSLDQVEENPLVSTPEEIQEVKDYFKTFGAWEKEEIQNWNSQEVNALLLQLISGDIRERESFKTENEWFEAMQEGNVSGNIFKTENGEYFYYIGQ